MPRPRRGVLLSLLLPPHPGPLLDWEQKRYIQGRRTTLAAIKENTVKKIIPLLLLLLLLFTGAAAEEYAIYESTTMGYRIPYPAH